MPSKKSNSVDSAKFMQKQLITSRVLLLAVLACLPLRNVAADNETEANKLISQAKNALMQGKTELATELYERASGFGEFPEAELGMVRSYLQAGEFRKTISFANVVAVEHRDVGETAAFLAYLEDREGHTSQALAKLKEALKQSPDNIALTGAYAEILLDRLALPQALSVLNAWIERNPPNSDIYRLRAKAAVIAGNGAETKLWRTKAAEATKENNISFEKNIQNQEPENQIQPTVEHWPAAYFPGFPENVGENFAAGNGFVIDQGNRVVTYASLVSGVHKPVWIRNGLGEIRQASVEKILPEQNLALLHLAKAYPKAWSLPLLPTATPENVKFCFVFGFPVVDPLEAGYPLMAPATLVRAKLPVNGLIQISGSLGPNTSGTAVLDGSGNLIGMTLGKNEPYLDITDWESQMGNGAFAVNTQVLAKLLPKPVKLKKKTLVSSKPADVVSVEALYEKLQPAAVSIIAPK